MAKAAKATRHLATQREGHLSTQCEEHTGAPRDLIFLAFLRANETGAPMTVYKSFDRMLPWVVEPAKNQAWFSHQPIVTCLPDTYCPR